MGLILTPIIFTIWIALGMPVDKESWETHHPKNKMLDYKGVN